MIKITQKPGETPVRHERNQGKGEREHCKCTGKIAGIPPRTHAEAPYRCSVRGAQGAKHTGNAKEHITTARRGMGGNPLGTHGET